jgi:hypothetical protein
MFEDFNMILNSNEKQGGRDNSSHTTSLFHNTLMTRNLLF